MRCIMANGKILKQSRDHNVPLFGVISYVILLLEFIQPPNVQNLKTLGSASAVPVISLESPKFF